MEVNCTTKLSLRFQIIKVMELLLFQRVSAGTYDVSTVIRSPLTTDGASFAQCWIPHSISRFRVWIMYRRRFTNLSMVHGRSTNLFSAAWMYMADRFCERQIWRFKARLQDYYAFKRNSGGELRGSALVFRSRLTRMHCCSQVSTPPDLDSKSWRPTLTESLNLLLTYSNFPYLSSRPFFRLSLGLSRYYHHYYFYLAATGAHEMDFTLTKLPIRGSFVTKLDFFSHALSLLVDKDATVTRGLSSPRHSQGSKGFFATFAETDQAQVVSLIIDQSNR